MTYLYTEFMLKNRLLYSFILFGFIFGGCSEKAAMPGKAFEGKIIQKIVIHGNAIKSLTKSSGDSAANSNPMAAVFMGGMNLKADVTMHVRTDKVAVETSMLGGLVNMRQIIDRNSRKMTMIVPMSKQAVVVDLAAMDEVRGELDDSLNKNQGIFDSLKKAIPKATGKKEEINGFDCEEYRMITDMNGTPMEVEMWITQDPRLKFYDVVRDALLGKKRTGGGGLEQLMAAFEPFAGHGKVAVKMILRVDGKEFLSSEMTEMVEEKTEDKYFEIPKGYEVKQQSLADTTHGSH
jgi:hypothetical protein